MIGESYTYDLGWEARSDGVQQKLRFVLSVPPKPTTDGQPFQVTLARYVLGDSSPRSTSWDLDIASDPVTRNLKVPASQQRPQPRSCSSCSRDLMSSARACTVCPSYMLCWLCFMRRSTIHPGAHQFRAAATEEMPASSRPVPEPESLPTAQGCPAHRRRGRGVRRGKAKR